MFVTLRLRLTVLYVLSAMTLIAFTGGGSYLWLSSYFQTITDEALKHKMAHEYEAQGIALPSELEKADKDWYSRHGKPFPSEIYGAGANANQPKENNNSEYYDGEMAGTFVLPLNELGQLIFDPNPVPVSFLPDVSAAQAALNQQSDLRTVTLSNGLRARLLTYQLPRSDGAAILQVGQPIAAQAQILRFLLVATVGLGTAAGLLVGSVSWWLSGKSILPAQQAWAKQQVFIANASHELRAPLALIRASVEVAKTELDPSDSFKHTILQDTLNECDHMTHMIEDLLVLSRLDAAQVKLTLAPTPLAPLIEEIYRKMNRLAQDKQLEFSIAVPPLQIIADATRLKQVILIVLDNAFRYTPAHGKVYLAAVALAGKLSAPLIQITISDTGMGIAPEHLPHVFDRFYRGDSTRMSGNKGTGLGLAIAQSLMQRMGGKIALHSQLGQGTQVILTLPAAKT